MKAVLIGVGHWGRNHLKVYSELKEEGKIDDVIVFDVNKARAKKLAMDFGVIHCKNPNTILEDKDVKCASIVTPSPTHYKMAKKMMNAGIDVLVEKPLALTSTESWELVRLSKKLDRVLLVGHLFRFHNALIELKRIIKRGNFGDIIQIIIERSAFSVPRKDMGVLHALAIHDVDISCFLLDKKYPVEITAQAMSYYRDYPDEIASIFQKFDNGTLSVSNESWLNPFDGKIRQLFLIGTKGSAHLNLLVPGEINLMDTYIDNFDGKDLRVINEGGRQKKVKSSEPLKNEIEHFINCSLNGAELLIPPEIGARAVEMIEIAKYSIENKRTVQINEYFERNY